MGQLPSSQHSAVLIFTPDFHHGVAVSMAEMANLMISMLLFQVFGTENTAK